MRRTILATALLTTLAVAGCSTSGSEKTADTKPSRKTSEQTSPSPKQADEGRLKLGQVHHWSDHGENGKQISGTVTAIAYTQPDPGIDLAADISDYDNPDWVALEVKGCIDKDSATGGFSQEPWALAFRDDTRIDAPLISGSGTAKPEYSTQGTIVKPGDCLRGKITFSVEHGTRPTRIVWGPADMDPAEWAIPEA